VMLCRRLKRAAGSSIEADVASTPNYFSGLTDASSTRNRYDGADNVTSVITRKGDTITYTYDTLNRISTKTPPAPAPVVSYAYDLMGRLIGVSDNSTSMVAPVLPYSNPLATAAVSYDALNQPLSFTFGSVPAQTAPTASSRAFSYVYNSMNQTINQTATDNSWWSYPTTASSLRYSTNGFNQYTAVGAVTPTYDGNGNLTFDGTFTYGYDAESRLTSVAQSGTPIATYAYDAQGRRKSKPVGATTTNYLLDPSNRALFDYDGSSGQIARCNYSPLCGGVTRVYGVEIF
jgi:YD repeat-containing protein